MSCSGFGLKVLGWSMYEKNSLCCGGSYSCAMKHMKPYFWFLDVGWSNRSNAVSLYRFVVEFDNKRSFPHFCMFVFFPIPNINFFKKILTAIWCEVRCSEDWVVKLSSCGLMHLTCLFWLILAVDIPYLLGLEILFMISEFFNNSWSIFYFPNVISSKEKISDM